MGVTYGIFFKLNLIEVLTSLANLPLGCELSVKKVKIFCHTDDIALLATRENALQFMLDTLAPKLENLSLKINFEKFCNIVFKHERGQFQLTWRYEVSFRNKMVNVYTWVLC